MASEMTTTTQITQPVLSALNSSIQALYKQYTGCFFQLLYNSHVPPILKKNVLLLLLLLYHPIPVLTEHSICCKMRVIQSVYISVPPTW